MPQLRHALDVEVLNERVVHPDLQTRPVHERAKAVPLALVLDADRARRDEREDRTHGLGPWLLIVLMEDVDLHADPSVPAVLGRMEIDPGIHPAFQEELAAEIEV